MGHRCCASRNVTEHYSVSPRNLRNEVPVTLPTTTLRAQLHGATCLSAESRSGSRSVPSRPCSDWCADICWGIAAFEPRRVILRQLATSQYPPGHRGLVTRQKVSEPVCSGLGNRGQLAEVCCSPSAKNILNLPVLGLQFERLCLFALWIIRETASSALFFNTLDRLQGLASLTTGSYLEKRRLFLHDGGKQTKFKSLFATRHKAREAGSCARKVRVFQKTLS